MQFKLPEYLFSWAWTAQALKKEDPGFERSAGGLFLPSIETIETAADSPALAHFSRITPEGEEFAWLWLFCTEAEAQCLRLLQTFSTQVEPGDLGLIEATLPMPAPAATDPCYLQEVPTKWLAQEITPDIPEVWLGFDFRSYVRDRRLGGATEVLPSEEFRAIALR